MSLPPGPPLDIRAAARLKADELTIQTLVDLTSAEKQQSVQCPRKTCGLRFNVPLADSKVRLDAANKLSELGYGKAPTQKEDHDQVPLDVDATTLTDEQRTHLRQHLLRTLPDLHAFWGLYT